MSGMKVFSASLALSMLVAAADRCSALSPISSIIGRSSNVNPFQVNPPPYLALITNRNSCDTPEQLERSCSALNRALRTNQVHLVTVRITPSTADPALVPKLIRFLVDSTLCGVMVHQDWIPEAIQAEAHGIHMKESHHDRIPSVRRQFLDARLPPPLIGMTVHSVGSAIQAARHGPDYLLAGSCFVSGDSHPERPIVEGPQLPGRVSRALLRACPVLGIGGIHALNCRQPMADGAQGVAAIQSVLQSSDPAASVHRLSRRIQEAYVTMGQ